MKNKINVNISPNPLDLQTLHCSQNDTEERKFYFTLHNNGEVIDTTDISDPIFEPFSVYKGGTEQLLPVNTDDPTTSPIIADIQYPDEEKTEQEFTYRESPTTIDGKALVEKIKGNTIVWNQLVKNGNFADTSNWATSGATLTASNNILSLTGTSSIAIVYQSVPCVVGHKYLFTEDIKSTSTYDAYITMGGSHEIKHFQVNTTWQTISTIYEYKNIWTSINLNIFRKNTEATGKDADIKNAMLFDLTAMFGSTKADEIYAMEQSESGSGVAYFRSLFPLPYYSYEQGKLLSFNGEGIKTVGFNQWDEVWELGSINTSTGENAAANDTIRSKNYIPVIDGKNYYFKIGNETSANTFCYDANLNYLGLGKRVSNNSSNTANQEFYLQSGTHYIRFRATSAYGTTYKDDICINISSSENGKYEPYTSSTTSIPTLTYFPTGMKDVPSAYDELTNSKAITRVGERAYQNGDENDPAVKTDGTTTYYALDEEVVTQFTQASLICEDGESVLYQDVDSLVCDCTEDFSMDSGFKDCKIKFTNDDGVVYSNKIQLHIERKP